MTTFKNQLKTILLLGALSALLVGNWRLRRPSYLYLFGALALVMNLGAYFISDRIVLRMHRASESGPPRPGAPRFGRGAFRSERYPKPRVFVIPEEQPNAFARGETPSTVWWR